MVEEEGRWGALVANEKSGQRQAAEPLMERLRDRVRLRLYRVEAGRDPRLCAAQALRDGARFVVAAGGDGTVSAVASALVGTETPMGILPLGTANSVARALEIPEDPDAAASLWTSTALRRIDTALANGRTMVLLASVGLHAAAVAEAPPPRKRRWGGLAYLLTAFEKLRERSAFALTLELPDSVVECKAMAVTVANLAPTQTLTAQGPSVVLPDDGRLDATILAADTLPKAVASGIHLLRSAWANEPALRDDIGYVTTHRLVVHADPPQPVLIDGEEAGSTPLEVISRPGSLLVYAPDTPVIEKPEERKLDGLPQLRVLKRQGEFD